jgi:hypothetical protein
MARKPIEELAPEYRHRIEKGMALGLTRAQARGHGAEAKVHGPQASRGKTAQGVIGYVSQLRDDRQVKIAVTMQDGSTVIVFDHGGIRAGVFKQLIKTPDDLEDAARQANYRFVDSTSRPKRDLTEELLAYAHLAVSYQVIWT